MTNKKIGNDFESELCQILFDNGFWAHNLAQNQSGQPADVIAARNGAPYLIDCKVCSNAKKGLPLTRIEENQTLSMTLWKESGNGDGWFAILLLDEIYMMPHLAIKAFQSVKSCISSKEIFQCGTPLSEWILKCK